MTIRVAIIGAGMMGNAHSNAYARIPAASVTAVVDINSERAGKIALAHGARTYTTLAEMCASESIDMVDICTPTCTHKDLVIQCADRGMHVVVEKPIAQTIEEAQAMLDAVRRKNVIFMVAQVLRFWQEYAYLKQVCDTGMFGCLIQAWFNRVCGAPASDLGGGFADPKRNDLAPLELHIHDLDFIFYLLGKPSAVSSVGVNRPDISASYLKTQYQYKDLPGVVIEAEGGWWQGPIPFAASFRAVFEKAMLDYHGERLTLYEAGAPEPRIIDFSDNEQGEVKINAKSPDAFYNEIAYFVDCVCTNTPPTVITPAQSLTTLEILTAELRSAQSGQRVDLGKEFHAHCR